MTLRGRLRPAEQKAAAHHVVTERQGNRRWTQTQAPRFFSCAIRTKSSGLAGILGLPPSEQNAAGQSANNLARWWSPTCLAYLQTKRCGLTRGRFCPEKRVASSRLQEISPKGASISGDHHEHHGYILTPLFDRALRKLHTVSRRWPAVPRLSIRLPKPTKELLHPSPAPTSD